MYDAERYFSSNSHRSMFGEPVGSRFTTTTCRAPVKSTGSGLSQPYRNRSGLLASDCVSSLSRRDRKELLMKPHPRSAGNCECGPLNAS